MDWFERLTGFPETDPDDVRRRLRLDGEHLVSLANGARWRAGTLGLPSLAELRDRVAGGDGPAGRLRAGHVAGDVRALHRDRAYDGALFQVASQFNLLEMTGPGVTPEHGVTRYASDPTQGPACAIAAGAATVARNYLVPVDGQPGQARDRQIDALADLGGALSRALGRPVSALWSMRNGYALCGEAGLAAIDAHLAALDEPGRDALRARLRIGVHARVEVTDGTAPPRPVVSQALCSALPVAYTRIPPARWARFARLVLEAAYEATLLAGVLNARQGGAPRVMLTRVGGGAFGNEAAWIDDAIDRALDRAAGFGLDVRLVTTGAVPDAWRAVQRRHDGAG